MHGGIREVARARLLARDAMQRARRVIEFGGPGVEKLSVRERMTLCGLCVDLGGETGIVPAANLERVGASAS